jgi:hypothetical protein
MDFSRLTIHAEIDNTGTAPETPASRDKRKIAVSFQRSGRTPNARHGSPHFVQHKMIFRDNGQQARLNCKGMIALLS